MSVVSPHDCSETRSKQFISSACPCPGEVRFKYVQELQLLEHRVAREFKQYRISRRLFCRGVACLLLSAQEQVI